MGTSGFSKEVSGTQHETTRPFYLALGIRRTARSRERRRCPGIRDPLPRIRVAGGGSEREGVEGFWITGTFSQIWC
jgi:hypothetical protein